MRHWWSSSKAWNAVALVAVSSGLAVRCWLALNDLGIYWPDEVYQSLEPAHRSAFGYGLVAWEFVAGARNMLFPWLLAAVLKLSALVGLDAPDEYLPLIRLGFASSFVVTALGLHRLAKAVGCSLPAAVTAVVALSWMSLAIYFAPRAMSEVASTGPLVWGLALVFEKRSTRLLVVGGALLSLAVTLRLHCGVFAAGAVLALLGRRDFVAARTLFLTLLAGALGYGVLDWVAWGELFHSARVYLSFSFDGGASEFGVGPPAFYTKYLTKSLGLLWVVLAALWILGLRRATALGLISATFFLLHLAQPHKELRFLVPMLPLITVGAAAGIDELAAWRWWLGLGSVAIVLVSAAWSLVTFHSLTLEQIGRYSPESAYDFGGPTSRLLKRAGREPGVCGVAVRGTPLRDTFGYTALHRDVPLYQEPLPDPAARHFDVLITDVGTTEGTALATDGQRVLVRLFEGPCVADPAFAPWLDERTRSLAAGN